MLILSRGITYGDAVHVTMVTLGVGNGRVIGAEGVFVDIPTLVNSDRTVGLATNTDDKIEEDK